MQRLKNLTVKQAERWLQRIKETDPAVYRDIGKFLRKFDQTSDQLECFVKMNQVLYTLPTSITLEINSYMEEGNKFAINFNFQDRLNVFLDTVGRTKKQILKQIVEYVNKIIKQQNQQTKQGIGPTMIPGSSSKNILQLSNKQGIKVFKAGIIEIVKNYPHLVQEAEKILPLGQEEAIEKLDLRHLKNKVISAGGTKTAGMNKFGDRNAQGLLSIPVSEQQQLSQIEQQQQLQINKNSNTIQIPAKKPKKPEIQPTVVQKQANPYIQMPTSKPPTRQNNSLYLTPSFLTTSEQKMFIKQLQKKLGAHFYREVIKVLELYQHNIITRQELIALVGNFLGDDVYGFKDIIEAREIDRRKNSLFKPLSDIDFHILPRQTHSYVQMPHSYPHSAPNRTPELNQILNNQWVSVPRGSQVIFNVRIKNPYEIILNKCQDERYQFDLIIRRFRKIREIFKRVLQNYEQNRQIDVKREVKIAIGLGVIQLLYKNASKDYKDMLQDQINTNPIPVIKVFLQRIKKTVQQLQQYKNLYATKMWSEAAHKNFHKSLDFKNHEFKNYQKLRLKHQSFIEQLNLNVQYLQSRGTKRINQNPFQGRKQFFSVLNSFQTCSRKQRCQSRKTPKPKIYNITDYRFPTLLPAMILAFQDKQVINKLYTIVMYYLECSVANQNERLRSKVAFRQIMANFFKISDMSIRAPSQLFEEDKFYGFLSNIQALDQRVLDTWIYQAVDADLKSSIIAEKNQRLPVFRLLQDIPSEYTFQPPKSDKNVVFYASQNFYLFLRFFYILYQRIIRMSQVSQSSKVQKMFQLLYYASIKTKQNLKFEESMNSLFGHFAYLFTTVYKIVQGVVKALHSIALSPIQNYSFTLLGVKNEEVYLLLLNRYMLNLPVNTTHLIRATFQTQSKLLYINSFNPYYRFMQQNLKQCNKKRLQISKNVQNYNTEKSKDGKMVSQKQQSTGHSFTANRQEYYFENNSNRLINIASYEDVIVGAKKQTDMGEISKELAKIKRVIRRLY